jgi:general secretion pathway protein D
LPATGGGATFNFEGESLHAVVKAILGDMLGQNYVIAPGCRARSRWARPSRSVRPKR